MKRPIIEDGDCIFWLIVMRMLKEWREALVFGQPATLIKWHRKDFRYYWGTKSQSKPGRTSIRMEVILLIRKLSQENVLWGAPRIKAELALLGHEVAESTVAKYNAGSTWNFQFWYRDPTGPATFNSSDATSVTFLP